MAGYDNDLEQLNAIRVELDNREETVFSPFATLSRSGIRRRVNESGADLGYRQHFSQDVDRILHSLAYTRYIDKTQVFYLTRNDHITHRVLHVQLVSKIARTIGRFLRLNEDLIEAVSLGHDIGHTPFGHDGETILSELCEQSGVGYFYHSVQSVQFLEKVERKGRGWNLCLQTLDGILCHDGEIHQERLEPDSEKDFIRLDEEIRRKRANPGTQLRPMTLEGCVMRFADTISYIGRDIEDAIRLRIIKRSDIPESCVKHLGDSNGAIVFNLVTDVIRNSIGKPYIAFSPQISESLKTLKKFNMEAIYQNPSIKPHTSLIRDNFRRMFETFSADIEQNHFDSVIYAGFLENMAPSYVEGHDVREIVRDFIAGMTDRYFLEQCPDHMRPAYRMVPGNEGPEK